MIAKPLIMVPAALLVGGAAAPAAPAAPAPAPASAPAPAAKTYHMNKYEARGRAIGRHYENLYR